MQPNGENRRRQRYPQSVDREAGGIRTPLDKCVNRQPLSQLADQFEMPVPQQEISGSLRNRTNTSFNSVDKDGKRRRDRGQLNDPTEFIDSPAPATEKRGLAAGDVVEDRLKRALPGVESELPTRNFCRFANAGHHRRHAR